MGFDAALTEKSSSIVLTKADGARAPLESAGGSELSARGLGDKSRRIGHATVVRRELLQRGQSIPSRKRSSNILVHRAGYDAEEQPHQALGTTASTPELNGCEREVMEVQSERVDLQGRRTVETRRRWPGSTGPQHTLNHPPGR